MIFIGVLGPTPWYLDPLLILKGPCMSPCLQTPNPKALNLQYAIAPLCQIIPRACAKLGGQEYGIGKMGSVGMTRGNFGGDLGFSV